MLFVSIRMHIFIYSINQPVNYSFSNYLLSIYYGPKTVLVPWSSTVSKIESLMSQSLHSSEGFKGHTSKQVNKIISNSDKCYEENQAG